MRVDTLTTMTLLRKSLELSGNFVDQACDSEPDPVLYINSRPVEHTSLACTTP